MTRLYQPAWNHIKKEGFIRLSAEAHLHPRIYKAIRKEKDMDTVYKYEMAERGDAGWLSSSSKGTILTIILTVRASVKNYNPTNLFT